MHNSKYHFIHTHTTDTFKVEDQQESIGSVKSWSNKKSYVSRSNIFRDEISGMERKIKVTAGRNGWNEILEALWNKSQDWGRN